MSFTYTCTTKQFKSSHPEINMRVPTVLRSGIVLSTVVLDELVVKYSGAWYMLWSCEVQDKHRLLGLHTPNTALGHYSLANHNRTKGPVSISIHLPLQPKLFRFQVTLTRFELLEEIVCSLQPLLIHQSHILCMSELLLSLMNQFRIWNPICT